MKLVSAGRELSVRKPHKFCIVCNWSWHQLLAVFKLLWRFYTASVESGHSQSPEFRYRSAGHAVGNTRFLINSTLRDNTRYNYGGDNCILAFKQVCIMWWLDGSWKNIFRYHIWEPEPPPSEGLDFPHRSRPVLLYSNHIQHAWYHRNITINKPKPELTEHCVRWLSPVLYELRQWD